MYLVGLHIYYKTIHGPYSIKYQVKTLIRDPLHAIGAHSDADFLM